MLATPNIPANSAVPASAKTKAGRVQAKTGFDQAMQRVADDTAARPSVRETGRHRDGADAVGKSVRARTAEDDANATPVVQTEAPPVVAQPQDQALPLARPSADEMVTTASGDTPAETETVIQPAGSVGQIASPATEAVGQQALADNVVDSTARADRHQIKVDQANIGIEATDTAGADQTTATVKAQSKAEASVIAATTEILGKTMAEIVTGSTLKPGSPAAILAAASGVAPLAGSVSVSGKTLSAAVDASASRSEAQKDGGLGDGVSSDPDRPGSGLTSQVAAQITAQNSGAGASQSASQALIQAMLQNGSDTTTALMPTNGEAKAADAPPPLLSLTSGSMSTALPTATSAAALTSGLSTVAIETTAQLAAQIAKRIEGRTTRFEMALTPEDLGRVDVSLDIDADGGLTARLAFDNPLAATELRGRADELRRQLQEAGFNVGADSLSFSEREAGSSNGGADRRFERDTSRAFAGAARLNTETEIAAVPPVWASLSQTPQGVDLKV